MSVLPNRLQHQYITTTFYFITRNTCLQQPLAFISKHWRACDYLSQNKKVIPEVSLQQNFVRVFLRLLTPIYAYCMEDYWEVLCMGTAWVVTWCMDKHARSPNFGRLVNSMKSDCSGCTYSVLTRTQGSRMSFQTRSKACNNIPCPIFRQTTITPMQTFPLKNKIFNVQKQQNKKIVKL